MLENIYNTSGNSPLNPNHSAAWKDNSKLNSILFIITIYFIINLNNGTQNSIHNEKKKSKLLEVKKNSINTSFNELILLILILLISYSKDVSGTNSYVFNKCSSNSNPSANNHSENVEKSDTCPYEGGFEEGYTNKNTDKYESKIDAPTKITYEEPPVKVTNSSGYDGPLSKLAEVGSNTNHAYNPDVERNTNYGDNPEIESNTNYTENPEVESYANYTENPEVESYTNYEENLTEEFSAPDITLSTDSSTDLFYNDLIGTTVTIFLKNQSTFCGEIVSCANNVISIKSVNGIVYINKKDIATFF